MVPLPSGFEVRCEEDSPLEPARAYYTLLPISTDFRAVQQMHQHFCIVVRPDGARVFLIIDAKQIVQQERQDIFEKLWSGKEASLRRELRLRLTGIHCCPDADVLHSTRTLY